ncbi:MAG: ribonuclease H-like domain-containing protein [Candidatus Woesearchaeota archaeon]
MKIEGSAAMIRNSFIWLEGVGETGERNFWEQGILSWNDFLHKEVKGISPKRRIFYIRQITVANKALVEDDSSFFVDKLPGAHAWRLYEEFLDGAVFLDIETNGTGANSIITIVGLFDGYETKIMVRGINLDFKVLERVLSKYKIIITFNGSAFDLPILKKAGCKIPNVPHIDLRHVCNKIGLNGGLKYIERCLNIERPHKVNKLSGGDATLLWKMYYGSGDEYYLNILVKYNQEDIINLKKIADFAVKKLSMLQFQNITKS